MELKTIKAYRIGELPGNIRTQIIQNYIDTHDWDVWKHERNKSFCAICDLLGFQLFSYDDDGGYGVGVEAVEIKGASRVIAYVTNRFPLKKVMWVADDKKRSFYKEHSDALALNRYTLWMPTGYVADFCLHNALDNFVSWVRKYHTADICTIEDFCRFLEGAFNEELNDEYRCQTSDEFAMDMLSDLWFNLEGANITALIEY